MGGVRAPRTLKSAISNFPFGHLAYAHHCHELPCSPVRKKEGVHLSSLQDSELWPMRSTLAVVCMVRSLEAASFADAVRTCTRRKLSRKHGKRPVRQT